MQRHPSIVFENNINRTYYLTNGKQVRFSSQDYTNSNSGSEKAISLVLQCRIHENIAQKDENFHIILLTIFPKEYQIAAITKMMEDMPAAEGNIYDFLKDQCKKNNICFNEEDTHQFSSNISGPDIILTWQDKPGEFVELNVEELQELSGHIACFNQPAADNILADNTKIYSTGTRHLTLLGNSPANNEAACHEDILEIEISVPVLGR